jgi:hypothetical protein
VQSALEAAAEELDRRYSDSLAARLTLTSGDEIQALLSRCAPALDLVLDLIDRLHPLRLRFGVGRGELTTPLRETTASLSGPAFYGAREAIRSARGAGRHVVLSGFGERNETLEVLADTAAAIAVGWTPVQRETVRAYLRHGSHRAAADALGKARSTVTRNLGRALASEMLRARDHVRELLAGIDEAADEARVGGPENARAGGTRDGAGQSEAKRR